MRKNVLSMMLAMFFAGALSAECLGKADSGTPEALITDLAHCAQLKNADGIIAHFTPPAREQMLRDKQQAVKVFETIFYGKMGEVGYALPKNNPGSDSMEMLVMWQIYEERTFDSVIIKLQKIRGSWFIERLDDAKEDDLKRFGKVKVFRVSDLPKGKRAPGRKPTSR